MIDRIQFHQLISDVVLALVLRGASMTVMMIPDRVTKAQVETLYEECSNLIWEVHSALCPALGSHCGDDGFDIFASKLHDSFSRAFNLALDCAPGSGAVKIDSSFAERQGLGGTQGGRGELLIGRVNCRLGQPLLWILGLLCTTPISRAVGMLLDFEPAVGESFAEYSEVFWKFVPEPSIKDLKNCIAVIEERDYCIARRAVGLSCGNPYGIAIHPKPVSVQEISEALLGDESEDTGFGSEDILRNLCASVDKIPASPDIDVEPIKRTLKSVFRRRIPAILCRFDSFITPSVMPEELAFLNEYELLERCRSVMDSLVLSGVFREANPALDLWQGGAIRLDASVLQRITPKPGTNELEKMVVEARIHNDQPRKYIYQVF